jgi:hypothetical protein
MDPQTLGSLNKKAWWWSLPPNHHIAESLSFLLFSKATKAKQIAVFVQIAGAEHIPGRQENEGDKLRQRPRVHRLEVKS